MKYVYFYDVPRTGTTSIKKLLAKARNVQLLRHGTRHQPWFHVPFDKKEVLEKKFNKKLFTFTFLRDPVEHTISLYSKIRNHNHALRGKLSKITFHQWITSHADDFHNSPPSWGLSFVKFFDPKGSNLDTAISNIRTIDFVGITSNLNSDINQMFKLLNIGCPAKNFNLNVSKKVKVSPGEIQIIRELRSEDYKLIKKVKEER